MRSDAVRRQQAQQILGLLKEGVALRDRAPVGAAKDAYDALIATIPVATAFPPSKEEKIVPAIYHTALDPIEVAEVPCSDAVTTVYEAEDNDASMSGSFNPGWIKPFKSI